MRSLLRLSAPLVGLLTAVLVVSLSPAAQPAAQPASRPVARVSAGASTVHPYSNPVWWPFAVSSRMGCFKGNPGCGNYHPGWLMDIGAADGRNDQTVYAMGAGVVHIGAAHQVCGASGSRGNWLWIDHGAGVLSYYGHLNQKLLVTSGEYVSARTPLGYADQTGYAGCKTHQLRYTFVAVKHGGTTGRYVEITHTYACVGGVRRMWPQQLPNNPGGRRAWTRWNVVPNLTAIPRMDTGRSCIAAPPASATRPVGVRLGRLSSTILRASWLRAGSRYKVLAARGQLQEYHPSIRLWLDARVHSPRPTAVTTAFTKLDKGRHYRFRAQFYNAAGWSAPSRWAYYTLPR